MIHALRRKKSQFPNININPEKLKKDEFQGTKTKEETNKKKKFGVIFSRLERITKIKDEEEIYQAKQYILKSLRGVSGKAKEGGGGKRKERLQEAIRFSGVSALRWSRVENGGKTNPGNIYRDRWLCVVSPAPHHLLIHTLLSCTLIYIFPLVSAGTA